ncbi:Hypothetical predicted protein [Paramuricea clavata]|uniref:Uncharacterized protein n=1 Tax=Paramuricea clavata TaxID=317549 RepID=A0A6S7HRW9_PARCT|nr:Hypothetical predicted protein [Paramuricea clavata]
MSYGTLSRIETIGSVDSRDLDSIATISSHEGNTIQDQPDGLPAIQEESTVPGYGFASTLGSIWLERWHNTGQAYHGSCCSKIKAFLMFITLPFYVLLSPFFRSRSTRRKVTHHGIVYFYILMASNIVFNLWEQQNNISYKEPSYQFVQYFEASIMLLSLIAMVYIARATRGEVKWTIHETNLIFYFRAGLYVFGISSMVYTALNIYDNFSCNDNRNIVLNSAKFLFITCQILFLNYYYQAKLPSCGWLIQVSLAHILGTNLSLWIWTLCKEESDPENESKLNRYPIHLGHTEKYFYPLFVEYLLLVASMIYELWMDLNVPTDARRLPPRQDWYREKYQEELESGRLSLSSKNEVSHPVHLVSSRRRRKFAPSLAFSFVLGLAFSSIFLAFLLAANDSGGNSWKDKKWYTNYLVANICLNSTQMIACYVAKVCSQSQPANRKRASLNLDDALLYFGLAGITLWEGFHFYGRLFGQNREPIHFVHGMLALIEDITQTVILVSVRRLSSRDDTNARAITNMSLYLLATNLSLWIQNSFYIGHQLEYPGEHKKILEEHLGTFASILNPIIIFFRFHSATCCYQMWVIFSHTNVIEN